MVIIVPELQFSDSKMVGISGDVQRGLGLVAFGFNECLEAESLQTPR